MSATSDTAPGLFAFDDDAALALAREHGTPCFAYRGAVATACWRRLREAMPTRVRVAFAVKANPDVRLLRRLADLGASFDCASEGELLRVASLGLPADRALFAGPGKRMAELRLALKQGVRIQAEGWEDLARVDALAVDLGLPSVALNLRVHPKGGVAEANRIIGGTGPSAFGVDEEDVPSIVERARALGRVRIEGLHVFAASNERDATRLLSTHAMVLDLALALSRDHGLALRQVDLGGGLGVPYSPAEAPLDVAALGRGLAEALAARPALQGEVILEPGRFLAAPCGVYLARVVRVKASRGARFAILEGGVNHLLRPLLTRQAFPVRLARPSDAPLATTTLAGPLCTSLDRLGDVALPSDLAADDLLVFGTAGAYGFTEGMTHFLSHPVPPEVWVDD